LKLFLFGQIKLENVLFSGFYYAKNIYTIFLLC